MAFRSGLEEKVADLMIDLGVKYEYESTKVPYQIQHNYTPDFLLPNGIFLECKGYWDPEDRRKIKAVKQQNPELDIRMIFQSPYNKISKNLKLHTPSGAISMTYLGHHSKTSPSNGSSE